MSKRLYVGNLSYATTEDALRELFSNYTEVFSVSVIKDKFTEQSKGFGFVEVAEETFEKAIGGTNGKEIDGRRIRVSEAQDKERLNGGAGSYRKNFGDRSRRDFSDRRPRFEGDGAEEHRDFGDRPRRNFGDRRSGREFGDRPRRRDFGDRRESGRTERVEREEQREIPDNEY